MPVKIKLMHVKKFGKISRENTNLSAKTIKLVPVKMNFLPVKKTKKRPKTGRVIGFLPMKKLKNNPKQLSRALFFFNGKKKHCNIRYHAGNKGRGGGLRLAN